tara:strand:+ start:3930 stop:4655 length:726 start_codon:yes stop_codon:yes gene_type:complete
MKIALCLHGLFDSSQDMSSKGSDGFNHIKKNILDNNNVDVFIHSWEVDKKDEINNLYKPVKSLYETQIDFEPIVIERNLNSLTRMPRLPKNVLSHLYSVSQAVSLVYESSIEYDIVIKARFDLGRINRNTSGPGHMNPYPVQCINFQTDIENDKLYTADWNHFHMGPADMWFYGSSKVMHNFVGLYESLKSEMYIGSEFHKFATDIENNPGDLSNSIAFLKYWMINNGLWDNKVTLPTTWE